jgi:hypothetical protein
LRKIVLPRWSVGAVGAGSVPGGAAGGARFGVLRLGEWRVPSRDSNYVGRDKVRIARERGVGVGRRLVGRRRARHQRVGRRRAGRGRRGSQQPPPWPVAGEGAPRCEVRGEVVEFKRFLKQKPWVLLERFAAPLRSLFNCKQLSRT